ncbi:GspH/FimT family pseudopilin [Alteromonas gilva]|uniref:Type II secretion system protein H n=1 Tax=Alteromonas gilva TaxID=2987522 RepID=A0ABT5L0C3_9ALTE|nr:GspH/FimT family pseudopilin [Alteromonas gilva]MDC8829881.1 GspH/FimT family pseudopilin [Alteromonas gilva]
MKNAARNGFTLLELMTVVAIIALLATLVVPSFAAMLNKERLVSMTNNLAATYQAARSEAIKRNTDVSMQLVNRRWQAQDADTAEVFVYSGNFDGGVSVSQVPELNIAATGSVSVVPPATMPVQITLANLHNEGCSVLTILPSGQMTTNVGSCP